MFEFMSPHKALDRLLEREENAIKTANFKELEGILALKDSLLKRLNSARISADVMEALSRRLRRNSELLEAAKNGILMAQTQLRRSERAARFDSYDSDGAGCAIGGEPLTTKQNRRESAVNLPQMRRKL